MWTWTWSCRAHCQKRIASSCAQIWLRSKISSKNMSQALKRRWRLWVKPAQPSKLPKSKGKLLILFCKISTTTWRCSRSGSHETKTVRLQFSSKTCSTRRRAMPRLKSLAAVWVTGHPRTGRSSCVIWQVIGNAWRHSMTCECKSWNWRAWAEGTSDDTCVVQLGSPQHFYFCTAIDPKQFVRIPGERRRRPGRHTHTRFLAQKRAALQSGRERQQIAQQCQCQLRRKVYVALLRAQRRTWKKALHNVHESLVGLQFVSVK